MVIRGSVAHAGLEVGSVLNLIYALLSLLTCTKDTVAVILPLRANPELVNIIAAIINLIDGFI
jgi:hypothetical protein